MKAYASLYLNESRFKIIEEFENCYKICKEDVDNEIEEINKRKEAKKKKEE